MGPAQFLKWAKLAPPELDGQEVTIWGLLPTLGGFYNRTAERCQGLTGSTCCWPFLLFLLQILLPLISVALILFLVHCVLQLSWLISHQESKMQNCFVG